MKTYVKITIVVEAFNESEDLFSYDEALSALEYAGFKIKSSSVEI